MNITLTKGSRAAELAGGVVRFYRVTPKRKLKRQVRPEMQAGTLRGLLLAWRYYSTGKCPELR